MNIYTKQYKTKTMYMKKATHGMTRVTYYSFKGEVLCFIVLLSINCSCSGTEGIKAALEFTRVKAGSYGVMKKSTQRTLCINDGVTIEDITTCCVMYGTSSNHVNIVDDV